MLGENARNAVVIPRFGISERDFCGTFTFSVLSAVAHRSGYTMLAAFRFKNFRSFRGQADLSFAAYGPDQTHPEALIDPSPESRSKLRLLPVAAIYGPNAAGKTNVLRALRFMRQAVMRSQAHWSPTRNVLTEQFASKAKESSSFEVEVFIDGSRYQYGFAADRRMFLEEWLYWYPKGKKRKVFDRETNRKTGATSISVGDSFGRDKRYVEAVRSRVRQNSLFVSAAAQDNHDVSKLLHEFFKNILFASLHPNEGKSQQLSSALLHRGGLLKELMLTFLKQADPSILDIRTTVIGEHENDDDDDTPAHQLARTYKVTFVLGKGRSRFELDLEQQSSGIQRLYRLLGEICGSIITKKLLLIDEVEASLHPVIARFLVDLFQNAETNREGSQAILTTHDTGLLDQTLFRRDQIWFVEKERCCSHLYSLLKFSPRKDSDLERGYLRGRYGAIPAADLTLDWLMRENGGGAS